MTIEEHAPLAAHTTFRLGGPAQLLITCTAADELSAAVAVARERGLEPYPLGGGSNILAADDAIGKAIIRLVADSISFEEEGERALAIADAGTDWNTFVDATAARGLWGLENLAGIPGSVGAAPVQNIGAYGAEVADTLEWVEAFDLRDGTSTRFTRDDCGFAYRDSRFKRERTHFITKVAFALRADGAPNLSYPDVAKAATEATLATPADVANAVRAIRSQKFPDLAVCGTAGSFFKNPTISADAYAVLKKTYSELPGFSNGEGVKVSLAWILDRVLNLRGHAHGNARLFEKQPLVLVAEAGATARDVDALANDVAARVHAATGISIEREVQSLS